MINGRFIWTYKEFYSSDPPSDEFVFLRKYPTDLIILNLSKINALLFLDHESGLPHLAKITKQVFPRLSEPRRQRSIQLIKQADSVDEGTNFFSAQAISKLISICFTNFKILPHNIKISEEDFQNDLWDNILLANHVYYNYNLAEEDDINTYPEIWKLGMLQQFHIRRFGDLNYVNSIEVMFFYKFIRERIPDGEQLIAEFVTNLGLTNFFQHPTLVLKFLKTSLNEFRKDNKAKWTLNLTDQFKKVIEPFAYKTSELDSNRREYTVHNHVMTHPIYFLFDKHPIVVDFNFLSFMAALALTYNFHRNTSVGKKLKCESFNEFKGWLGKHYYEEFLTESILRGIFKEPLFKISNDREKSLVDFSIASKNEIYLIEVKSNEMPRGVLDKFDTSGFQDFLDKNFASNKKAGKRNTGVYQLLTAIDILANTDKYDEIMIEHRKKRKLEIYPVIIYTERAITIDGVNSYIQETFSREARRFENKFNKIYPVTLISMSALIEKMYVVYRNPSTLKKWIKEYWRRNNSNRKSFSRSGDPNQFYNSCLNFDNFLRKVTEDDYPNRENFIAVIDHWNLRPPKEV